MECTANGTEKTETIVNTVMRNQRQLSSRGHSTSFVKPVSSRKLLEDEEKLKFRTIPFGEKMNEVRNKTKVAHKIMPNTAKVSLILRFPFLTIKE